MELVSGHGSFLALTNREALSNLDASFKFARASSLFAGEPWATARMEQRAFYVSPAVIEVCTDLVSASVRMRQQKGSRFVKDVVSWPRKLVARSDRPRD